jgi:hypothetical protein
MLISIPSIFTRLSSPNLQIIFAVAPGPVILLTALADGRQIRHAMRRGEQKPGSLLIKVDPARPVEIRVVPIETALCSRPGPILPRTRLTGLGLLTVSLVVPIIRVTIIVRDHGSIPPIREVILDTALALRVDVALSTNE